LEAAWLNVVPGVQSVQVQLVPGERGGQCASRLDALQRQIVRLDREQRLSALAPILTFQSVIDFTVSTPAILSALYAHLPANGSELVLFDVNRTVKFGPLLRPATDSALQRLLPPLPQRYRLTMIANATPDSTATVVRTIEEVKRLSGPASSAFRIRARSSRCHTSPSRFPWTTRSMAWSPTRQRTSGFASARSRRAENAGPSSSTSSFSCASTATRSSPTC
jgi:hypothetical protein